MNPILNYLYNHVKTGRYMFRSHDFESDLTIFLDQLFVPVSDIITALPMDKLHTLDLLDDLHNGGCVGKMWNGEEDCYCLTKYGMKELCCD